MRIASDPPNDLDGLRDWLRFLIDHLPRAEAVEVTLPAVSVSAQSTLDTTFTVQGADPSVYVLVRAATPLPDGVIVSFACYADNIVTMRAMNVTGAGIAVPASAASVMVLRR